MIILTELIGKGATRDCYQHPTDANKCIKILSRPQNISLLARELKYYPLIRQTMGNFTARYDSQLVETNRGPGLVCELFRDDDGSISKPLNFYVENNLIDAEIKSQLDTFVHTLLAYRLFFYDFNLQNFVIQQTEGHKKLKYTDLKSFRRKKSWTLLKLENVFPPLARKAMLRRLRRLYQRLGLDFPLP